MTKPLKVALVSHSDRLGGASVVTFRLMNALRMAGIDARMVVFFKTGSDPNVLETCPRNRRIALFLAERGCIFMKNGFSRKNLFKVSIANTGLHLHNHPWIKQADIIALNWINQGMLSLEGIHMLAKTGKPIVWTMHDMWCMTGICHHAHECDKYKEHCGNCPYILNAHFKKDLSYKVWNLKNELYNTTNIKFVAVSNWLAKKCKESSLLREKNTVVIPNAFPVDFYMTTPSAPVKEYNIDYSKNIIIMGAARLDDPIKGFDYAIDALNTVFERYPEKASDCIAVFFGDIRDTSLLKRIKMPYHHLGRINDPKLIRQLYASSKVVISTSLYETLPGTLIEGQAAGCVPVSFGQGGQSDIIEHKVNGYIADYLSAGSIAEGIVWALDNAPSRESLHESVKNKFASEIVAKRYIDLFNSLLNENKEH